MNRPRILWVLNFILWNIFKENIEGLKKIIKAVMNVIEVDDKSK